MKQQFHSESWQNLPWKQFRKTLFRLQHRVWKAVRANDLERAKNLQKLILRSRCAQFMAVRRVTQLNQGKKTAGIDGKVALKYHERFELVKLLAANTFNWRHQKLRQIPIPKKDGSLRMLKVPTIADRAWQCLVKFAMEPAHEATFHANSYGFRPGRGTWDAQRAIFQKLCGRKGLTKTILELDIEKCFDRINHHKLLKLTLCPQGIRLGLLRCLKAGVNPDFPNQGTPQGGVVSPLLANIALNGIEDIGRIRVPNGQRMTTCIRYADDMVFFLYPNLEPQTILNDVREFLRVRGLTVKASKTHIVPATDGFDFLGWNIRVRPEGKCVIVPSKDNYTAFKKKVKSIANSSNLGAEIKARILAPIVRGWRTYHRYCLMKGSRDKLVGIIQSAYKQFHKQPSINRYKAAELIKKAFPSVGYKQAGHVKVKGDKTPFDGDFIYWSRRKSPLYGGLMAKVLQKQKHTCGYCGLTFSDEETIQLHHIDGCHGNWRFNNLTVVHASCHHYIHMSKDQELVIA